jgi:hypothetical protein
VRTSEFLPLCEEVGRIVGVETTLITEPEELTCLQALPVRALYLDVTDEFPFLLIGTTNSRVRLDEDLTSLLQVIGTKDESTREYPLVTLWTLIDQQFRRRHAIADHPGVRYERIELERASRVERIGIDSEVLYLDLLLLTGIESEEKGGDEHTYSIAGGAGKERPPQPRRSVLTAEGLSPRSCTQVRREIRHIEMPWSD